MDGGTVGAPGRETVLHLAHREQFVDEPHADHHHDHDRDQEHDAASAALAVIVIDARTMIVASVVGRSRLLHPLALSCGADPAHVPAKWDPARR